VPAFYKIDKERRLVMTTAWGVATMRDAWKHQQNLMNDPDFAPGFSELSDFTNVTTVELSMENVHRLAQIDVFSPDSRRAFLVNSDAADRFARMFENLRKEMGEHGIRVFRELDHALLWVLSEKRSN
jgi:hypothetical protein